LKIQHMRKKIANFGFFHKGRMKRSPFATGFVGSL
jgi:hypothetical protein